MCLISRCDDDDLDGDEEEIRYTPQLSHITSSLWSNILFNATQGKVSRDHLTGLNYLKLFKICVTHRGEGGLLQCATRK